MSEYIDRDKLVDSINELPIWTDTTDSPCFDCGDVNTMIGKIPAADVALVRHGKWVLTNPSEPEIQVYERSVCEHIGCVRAKQNYCPHCGAKMDLEAEK